MNKSYNSTDIGTVISFTLYSYNYYDSRLISLIKRLCSNYYNDTTNNIITVSAYELQNLINSNFSKILLKALNSSPNELPSNVNSIYFINDLLHTYTKLQYVKIIVSAERDYTRIITDNNQKTITFDYKMDSIFFNTAELFDKNERILLNELLLKLNITMNSIFRKVQPYINLQSSVFIDKIDDFINTNGIDSDVVKKYNNILNGLATIFNNRLRNDNPKSIIVLDNI